MICHPSSPMTAKPLPVIVLDQHNELIFRLARTKDGLIELALANDQILMDKVVAQELAERLLEMTVGEP